MKKLKNYWFELFRQSAVNRLRVKVWFFTCKTDEFDFISPGRANYLRAGLNINPGGSELMICNGKMSLVPDMNRS